MLDAYIIDAIRQRELERQREAERRIHLELPEPPRAPKDEGEPTSERGPIVIPLHQDSEPEDDAA